MKLHANRRPAFSDAETHILITMYNSWLRGGVQMYVYNILRSMNLSGIKIDIYVSHTVSDFDFLKALLSIGNGNISLYSGEGKKFHIINNIKKLCILMKKNNYDAIHVNTGNLLFQAINLFLARLFHIKIRIAHSHNAVIDLRSIHKYRFVRGIKRISYRVSRIIVNSNANYFFACSNIAGVWLFGKKNWNKKGILQKNGIIPEEFAFDFKARNDIRKEYGISDESNVIGLVANFNIQKNQKFLILIFAELLKNAKNSYLMLVGDGDKKDEIKKMVKNMSVKNVIFIDSTSIANKYYSAFDIFVMTSLYEGLPFVSIEAQSSGLPCILSDSITKEAKLADDVSFISLNESPLLWAGEIDKSFSEHKNSDRAEKSKSNIDSIRREGYDLSESVRKLENVYKYGKLSSVIKMGGD